MVRVLLLYSGIGGMHCALLHARELRRLRMLRLPPFSTLQQPHTVTSSASDTSTYTAAAADRVAAADTATAVPAAETATAAADTAADVATAAADRAAWRRGGATGEAAAAEASSNVVSGVKCAAANRAVVTNMEVEAAAPPHLLATVPATPPATGGEILREGSDVAAAAVHVAAKEMVASAHTAQADADAETKEIMPLTPQLLRELTNYTLDGDSYCIHPVIGAHMKKLSMRVSGINSHFGAVAAGYSQPENLEASVASITRLSTAFNPAASVAVLCTSSIHTLSTSSPAASAPASAATPPVAPAASSAASAPAAEDRNHALLPVAVVGAIDVNPTAMEVYRWNFLSSAASSAPSAAATSSAAATAIAASASAAAAAASAAVGWCEALVHQQQPTRQQRVKKEEEKEQKQDFDELRQGELQHSHDSQRLSVQVHVLQDSMGQVVTSAATAAELGAARTTASGEDPATKREEKKEKNVHRLSSNCESKKSDNSSYLSTRSVSSFSAVALAAFAADMWLVSPPCQPFTRSGLRKGNADARTSSLLHLLETLCTMKQEQQPKYLLLENVVGFESSDTFASLLHALRCRCCYDIKVFHLNPLHFGIPNCRSRCFITAVKRNSVAAAAAAAAVHVETRVGKAQTEEEAAGGESDAVAVAEESEKTEAATGEAHPREEKKYTEEEETGAYDAAAEGTMEAARGGRGGEAAAAETATETADATNLDAATPTTAATGHEEEEEGEIHAKAAAHLQQTATAELRQHYSSCCSKSSSVVAPGDAPLTSLQQGQQQEEEEQQQQQPRSSDRVEEGQAAVSRRKTAAKEAATATGMREKKDADHSEELFPLWEEDCMRCRQTLAAGIEVLPYIPGLYAQPPFYCCPIRPLNDFLEDNIPPKCVSLPSDVPPGPSAVSLVTPTTAAAAAAISAAAVASGAGSGAAAAAIAAAVAAAAITEEPPTGIAASLGCRKEEEEETAAAAGEGEEGREVVEKEPPLSLEQKRRIWHQVDLVRKTDRRSSCFTCSYGKSGRAQYGSLLLLNEDLQLENRWKHFVEKQQQQQQMEVMQQQQQMEVTQQQQQVEVTQQQQQVEVMQQHQQIKGKQCTEEKEKQEEEYQEQCGPTEVTAEQQQMEEQQTQGEELLRQQWQRTEKKEQEQQKQQQQHKANKLQDRKHVPPKMEQQQLVQKQQQQRRRRAGWELHDILPADGVDVRFFTVREMLSLHGFPAVFAFPASSVAATSAGEPVADSSSSSSAAGALSWRQQQRRLVGNSLNVYVVAMLIDYLVDESDWK